MCAINIDCYLAVLKDFRKRLVHGHFEVITRTAKSCLSPSKELLDYAKKNKIPFEEYRMLFLDELKKNSYVPLKLKALKQISKERVVFLVCYEKDASKCHRSIVKDILMNPKKYGYDLTWNC